MIAIRLTSPSDKVARMTQEMDTTHRYCSAPGGNYIECLNFDCEDHPWQWNRPQEAPEPNNEDCLWAQSSGSSKVQGAWCYVDNCPVHWLDKKNRNYFPTITETEKSTECPTEQETGQRKTQWQFCLHSCPKHDQGSA